MTTPSVQYRYANGSANQIRPTRTTYPDGRELNLDYGSGGGQDDILSRVAALVDDDGSTHLTDYSYLGLGTPVISDYAQPDVMYTLVGTAGGNDPDTGDIYRGLDRFGRVKDAYWRDYGASADAARIQYGYDRAGNRTYRADPVAVANSAPYEELYGYDAVQRLKTMDRGTLNGGKTALTTRSFDQCWTLDPTGNWKGFRQDDTGDGAWDLIQARTSNPVNEITNIANSVGSAWANPAYDAAGNMTTIPQPANPTQSYTAKYDAWNRLVKLSDGANTVAEYQYDARNYRTVQKSYTGGVLSETRHMYYTKKWQAIEERLGTSPDSANPERQFVWGQRYIDDCVLRDRDTDGNGTLDERLYALQDGNWNVIALADTSGDVQERYAYQAYGTPKFLTAAFANRASSSFGWETRFAGYRYDSAVSLYFVRRRILHASLGTWCRRDPIKYRGGINLLAYAHGIPLTMVDALGLDPCSLETAITDHFNALWDFYQQFPGNRLNDRCIQVTVDEYADWRQTINGYAPTRTELTELYRGCVGFANIIQKAPIKPTDVGAMPEDPAKTNTLCYLTRQAAEQRMCPNGDRRFIFAKQGVWRNGKKPEPDPKSTTVPNESITGLAGENEAGSGAYNYVFVVGPYLVFVNHCKLSPETNECDTSLSGGDDLNEQIIKVCKNSKLKEDGKYPNTIWCATCRPCQS